MTKAKVEVVFLDGQKRETIVEFKGAPKGARLLDAINKAVEKAYANDPTWTRWNLIDVLSAQGAK